MKAVTRLMERYFPAYQPVPAGIYYHFSAQEAELPIKLQLRIEADGRGLLIANGSTVLHLNQTATEYLYYYVQGLPQDQMLKTVSKRYGIKKDQAKEDYTALINRIKIMLETPDLDPVTYLSFSRSEPYSGAILAPYRIDCALTYSTPDPLNSILAPVSRVKRELTRAEWEIILQKASTAGIPHVVFTGGEPTLRPDLVDLIIYASKLGLVTGLISDGNLLSDSEYRYRILQSGLDHIMIVLDPDQEKNWETLQSILAEDISVTVHLTMTPSNPLSDSSLFDRLVSLGVTNVSISASDPDLQGQLARVRQLIADRALRLIWDLPVPYSSLHPVSMELADEENIPQGAGRAWIYIEPDGDVLRTQGDPFVLGNLLLEPWEEIWQALQA